MALARERVEFDGETLELPLPDGPGKALKLTIAPGAGADPDLHRGDRPEEHGAHRRDRRRLDPDALLARARGRVPPAARGGLRARRRRQVLRRLRHRADRQRRSSPTTATRRATRCARSSRSTSAGWARASRTSTTQLVRRYGFEDAARKVQDLYLEGQQGGGRRRAARRADRRGLAVRAARRRPRAAGRVPRRRASGR